QYAENLDAHALQGLRIGILDEMTYAVAGRTYSKLDPEIAAAFEAAVQELIACGAEVVHVEPQGLINRSTATHEDDAAYLKENVYSVFLNSLEEYEISAVIYPTYVTAPLHSGRDENGTYWSPYEQPYINNCRLLSPSSGAPEITVPLGLHSSGAGMGLEICAPKNEEQLLLNMAYAYMQRYNHRQTPAGAEDLHAENHAGTLGEILLLREEELARAEEEARLETERLKAEEEERKKAEAALREEAAQTPEPETEPIIAPVEPTPENEVPGNKTYGKGVWYAGGALAAAVLIFTVWRIALIQKQRHRSRHG
ncbi:MAG: hypothetical protein J6S41_05070, partial [Clostridia bacterium]|nr:hypothetical protein [Clostridia bacterium]